MKLLKDILYKASLVSTKGDMETPVREVVFDSRVCKPGDCFVAVPGTQVDGHEYIGAALKRGATSIVCQTMPGTLNEKVTYVQVSDSAKALGIMASNYYGHPSSKLSLVAVTGTNGKTTMVTLLHQLFTQLGYETGLVSTVENKIGENVIPATHTTPGV